MKLNFLFVLMAVCLNLNSQTARDLSLEEADGIFLNKNLMLLAGQYNISSGKALVLQAKAWPNPVVSADINVYDPQNDRYFHIDSGGQKAFMVEQLIRLGGKRKTEIAMARENQALAESEFQELLRNLRVQLRSSFFSIAGDLRLINNYNRQLSVLDTIIQSYKTQAEKGNLPLKDVVRLRSVYISISSNRAEVSEDLSEQQKQIRLLLRLDSDVRPLADSSAYLPFLNLRPLAELEDLALSNRPDLKMADLNTSIAELQLQLEKKQRIPDLSLNASYDQRGGAFRNQVNAGVAIPLPIFNSNRGNIRAAGFDKQAQLLYLDQKKLEVGAETQQAWVNMQRDISEYVKIRSFIDSDFALVNAGINLNFQKRNISILEFVDHVEAYNESLADFEHIKRRLAISAAMINFVTATAIY